MENVDESSILKPGKFNFNSILFFTQFCAINFLGMKIKPEIDELTVKSVMMKSYGIKALELCELNSYDDKNFLIFADK
jgi:hypothetical protein